MKRLWKILKWTVASLLFILLLAWVLLQFPSVQTALTNRVARALEDLLGAKVSVERVELDFFDGAKLRGILVLDHKQDTLLFADALSTNGLVWSKSWEEVGLGDVKMDKAVFKLQTHLGDEDMNLIYMIDHIMGPTDTTDTLSAPFTLRCRTISITNTRFVYRDQNVPDTMPGIDFSSIHLRHLNINADDFTLINDSVSTQLSDVHFTDHSGFELLDLHTFFQFGPTMLVLDETQLKTTRSDIMGRLAFKYNDLDELADFENKVKMSHTFDESTLFLGDLGWFAPELVGSDLEMKLSGKVKGRVKNLKGQDIDIRLFEKTHFLGDISLSGLPDIDQTFITLDVVELSSNKKEIELLPLPPFSESHHIELKDNLSVLGQMNFSGNFSGFVYDFTAYGTLETAIGDISSDISLTQKVDDYYFSGSLASKQFDLGILYDEPLLGTLTSTLEVSGKGLDIESLEADIKGDIKSIWVNGYNYTNIHTNGAFAKKFYDGNLKIEDDNLFMKFDGKLDFTTDIPAFSFDANIANIDLIDLGFIEANDYVCLSADISANARGLTLEEIIGTVVIKDLTYCTSAAECGIAEITLFAENLDVGKRITIDSPIVSGTLQGEFNIEGIQPALMAIVAELVPSIEAVAEEHDYENFELRLDIHDFTLIHDFFLPELDLADNSFLIVNINEATDNFRITAVTDTLKIMDYRITGTTLDARQEQNDVYFSILNDNVYIADSLNFMGLGIDGRTENSTVFFALAWENYTAMHSGDITGQVTIDDNDSFDFLFDRSTVTLAEQVWTFNPDASIAVDSTRIEAMDIVLFHGDQYIAIDGIISEHPKPWISAEINGFDLTNLNPFFAGSGTKFEGIVNGEASIRDFYNKRILNASLNIDELTVNESLIGDVNMDSRLDKTQMALMLNGEIVRLGEKSLAFEGIYDMESEDNPIDMDVTANHFNIGFLDTQIDEGISNLHGAVSGLININGSPDAIMLEGELNFEDLGFHVDYLNTSYTLSQGITIYPDMFALNSIEVKDQEGNVGHLVGQVIHDNFTGWNFDAFLDVEDTNFLCLNTSESENDLYYGKAYGRGYVGVSGYAENLELDIHLTSGPNTSISMPLDNSSEVTFAEFVSFVDRDAPVLEEKKELDLSGIKLNFSLDITPDASFRLIFDEAVGDVLSGKGTGHINMTISTLGQFEMNGEIEVVEGNYLFTLKNLINKEFEIIPGGSIRWYGDPMAADLQLQTLYRLSSPLNDILADNSGAYNQRVPVHLIMNLYGDMMNPEISFDIDLPTADQITRGRVESAISSEQELNRQAFALLVMRKFVAPPHVAGNGSGGAVAVDNTMEMLSAQVSRWLQDISDVFDIGFNYRPGDEISNDEISLALSTQLFSDKLSVSGNFGVSQGSETNQNPNSIIGDLKMEYKVTEDGKVRLIVYNQSNDFEVANTAQAAYTQGMGILYREEFNTMAEFYCAFHNLLRKKEDREVCVFE